jgi:hypothetical protein
MSTLPTSPRSAGDEINMANAAGTRVVEAADVLSPLLSKIAKFNDIVQEIADVC